jgi:ABC-type multidrug transport system ATPase subunit
MDGQSPAIELQNFSVSLISSKDVAKKHLIQPISLAVAPGSLFAIMGGSGCGKTTLINALSNKYDKKAIEVSGVLRFSNLIDTSALVTQSDHLIEHLTVKETLLFKAKLIKNQPEHDTKHSDSMVESVMRDLGLSSCADRLVGSNGSLGEKTSLSGGERRRVSIALQLLWDPKGIYLFLYFTAVFNFICIVSTFSG